jgi:hypothetical protein
MRYASGREGERCRINLAVTKARMSRMTRMGRKEATD